MSSKKPRLEDVAVLPPEKNLGLTLDEVGVENVQTQVSLQGLLLPARAQATVSLVDKESRGIHMSRIFRILNRLHEHELSWPRLNEALDQMLESHEGLSDAGHISLSFELPVLRPALLSGEQGWRSYPLVYKASAKDGKREMKLSARILYSSTCPCSASLSRQINQEQFRKAFREPEVRTAQVLEWLGKAESVGAVPHAQRSEAICEFTFSPETGYPSPLSLIDEMENALGTPVQAAVKREDEQEFARRNAQNLMFCEDAARKLKSALLAREELADFQIEVRHFESLHPHDVVAKVGKY
jgi:GTP cyclohydrolase I